MEVCDGRILRIDLSNGGCVNEIGLLRDYEPFLGGRGVNEALLCQDLTFGVSPFDLRCRVSIGAGLLCGTDAWNRSLDCHYDQHGWSRETGWPTEETLTALGLEVVVKRLREEGRIGRLLK